LQETARNQAKRLADASNGDESCVTYNDCRELLARQDIDVVLMATGSRSHHCEWYGFRAVGIYRFQ
jgi:predicted dehydrogenase